LKIARGKVKEFDKYTCPICDWRRKIPRDAARPKLEDLQDWQAEVAHLPFQPDEEEVLDNIVRKATAFRKFLQSFTNAACTTTEEVPTLIFYLRKIEGAEVLLAYETNFFRQEIHKWAPVAPEAPPILEQSLSTRKPRPTKSQKIMAQMGVERVEDLPAHLRPRLSSTSKRQSIDGSGEQRPTSWQGSKNSPFRFPGDPVPSSPPSLHLTSSSPEPAFPPPAAGHSPSFHPPPQGLDQPLFSQPATFNREQQEGATEVDLDPTSPFGSSPPRFRDIFAVFTNEHVDSVEPMENTHANEALEALDVSNGSDRHESEHAAESGENADSGEVEGSGEGHSVEF
jgi:histone demethylase JARID1